MQDISCEICLSLFKDRDCRGALAPRNDNPSVFCFAKSTSLYTRKALVVLNSRFVIMRNVSDVIILNRRVLSQMRSRCFASPLRVRLRPPCHYERNEVESKRFSAAEGVISGRTALRMTRSKFLRKDCRGIIDASQ